MLPHNLGCNPRAAAQGDESRGRLSPAGRPGSWACGAATAGRRARSGGAERPVGLPSHPFSAAWSRVVVVAREGLLVASSGLAGLVQTAGRSSSGTVTSPALSPPGSAAEEGADRQTLASPGRRGTGLNYLVVQLLRSRVGRREQLEPVWLKAKPGRAVPLSQLSDAPPWEGDKLVGDAAPVA